MKTQSTHKLLFPWLLVVALVLSACAPMTAPAQPPSAQPVTLTVIMEQVPDYDIVAELTKRFEAEHPDVRIRFDPMPYDAMRDKILTSFLAPQATYDVIIVDNPWMDEFAKAGFLAPLDDYITNGAS